MNSIKSIQLDRRFKNESNKFKVRKENTQHNDGGLLRCADHNAIYLMHLCLCVVNYSKNIKMIIIEYSYTYTQTQNVIVRIRDRSNSMR